MPANAVLLFMDETILRLFPPLRAKWCWRGQQAVVRITGQNDRLVLYGAFNHRTGRRIVMRAKTMGQADFHSFLRLLRRHCGNRPLWLLLDEASSHTAASTARLAAKLGITLVWLPKQCPELNAMDHLWRPIKDKISANRQYPTVNEQADYAEQYLKGLSPKEARRQAGVLSKHFWLRSV